MLRGCNTVLYGCNTVLCGCNTVLRGCNTVLYGCNTVLCGCKLIRCYIVVPLFAAHNLCCDSCSEYTACFIILFQLVNKGIGISDD